MLQFKTAGGTLMSKRNTLTKTLAISLIATLLLGSTANQLSDKTERTPSAQNQTSTATTTTAPKWGQVPNPTTAKELLLQMDNTPGPVAVHAHPDTIMIIANAIRLAGLSGDTSQLEHIRQWYQMAKNLDPAVNTAHYITGELLRQAYLALGRLGAGEETTLLGVGIARARTLADRAYPNPTTAKELQAKVRLFLSELEHPSSTEVLRVHGVLDEIALMARSAYRAGVKDAFEPCEVDWSVSTSVSLKVQAYKLPDSERAQWLVEQIGNLVIARGEHSCLLHLLMDEGSRAIPLIRAKLAQYKDEPTAPVGAVLLVDALGGLMYVDESAVAVLREVEQSFADKRPRGTARSYLEKWDATKQAMEPFLGIAPCPRSIPID